MYCVGETYLDTRGSVCLGDLPGCSRVSVPEGGTYLDVRGSVCLGDLPGNVANTILRLPLLSQALKINQEAEFL